MNLKELEDALASLKCGVADRSLRPAGEARILIVDITGKQWDIADVWITAVGDAITFEVMRKR